jgi:hypothetical protein
MAAPVDPAAPADPAAAPAGDMAATAPSGDPLAAANWPMSAVDRPLGLSAGMLQVDVNVATNMTKSMVADPINLPLSIWYGVSNELQVGVVHPVYGLCLSGDTCGKKYNDIGLQALYSLSGRGSALELATWAQLNVLQFSDPSLLQLTIGGAVNWVVADGMIAILAYPGVGIGVTERDINKETIALPVTAYFKATPELAPFLYTGISGALDGFGDVFAIPLGVGAVYGVSNMLDVGARFDFPNIAGKNSSADARSLTVFASVRPL